MKDVTSRSKVEYVYDPHSLGFPKAEHLCSKLIFNEIFEHGHSFRMGVLKFFYVWDVPKDWQDVPLQVGFSAPKRSFKRAVTRNLLRRRMREAYRQQKHIILEDLSPSGHRLSLFIKFQHRQEADYQRIRRAMHKGLKKLHTELTLYTVRDEFDKPTK